MGSWAGLWDLMASFEGLPPLGFLDCDGLYPEPGGYIWPGAGIYLHVESLGKQFHHV